MSSGMATRSSLIRAMCMVMLVVHLVPVSTARTQFAETRHHHQPQENRSAPVPQFTFNIKSTPCAKPTLGALHGLNVNFETHMEEVRKKAMKLAEESNCRLCDISGVSLGREGINVNDVKCAAYKSYVSSNTKEACLGGNGETGWLPAASNVCVPCPDGCKSCETPGKTDVAHMTSFFKCILPKELDNTPLGGPWECEDVANRRGHRGQMQWCKWRKNFLSTSTNGMELSSSQAWELSLAAVRCDGALLEAGKADLEKSGALAGLVAIIAPGLEQQRRKNCDLCQMEVGGYEATTGSGTFKLGRSKSKSWATSNCAFAVLGDAACRTDRGPTGWAKDCTPCPVECASCETITSLVSGRSFKCALRPTAAAVPQLQRLVSTSATTHEEADVPPATPQGYECSAPEPRACTSGGGLCMGYKTKCKVQEVK